jgi:DedD protein
MAEGTEQGERGLAARHLVLVFLAAVAVCAVFFSLGFLVGYHERLSQAATPVEHVSAPPVIPPPVNPPLETVQPETSTGTKTTPPANPPPGAPATSPAPPAPSPTPSTATLEAPPAAASSAPKAEDRVKSALPPSERSKAGDLGEGWTVQVVALQSQPDAERLVKLLKARGYPVFLVEPDASNRQGDPFRVQVGPFTSREVAEIARAQLVKEGFHPFIKH